MGLLGQQLFSSFGFAKTAKVRFTYPGKRAQVKIEVSSQ
jgi:hypothetical protein